MCLTNKCIINSNVHLTTIYIQELASTRKTNIRILIELHDQSKQEKKCSFWSEISNQK